MSHIAIAVTLQTSSPLPSKPEQPTVPCKSRRATAQFQCRRWISVLAAAVLMLVGISTPAQTYLIDFGGPNTTTRGSHPNDPEFYWNNVGLAVGTTDSGVLSNLLSSLNSTSSIHLVMVSRFNGNNDAGTQFSFFFPTNATRDSLYGNTEVFNGLTNIFPSFKLAGLDAATKYSFTFYASRSGTTDNRETGYTVTGNNSGFAALNAAENYDTTVTVTDITPDAQGEITISLAPTANNDNANHFTYLGFMKVDAVPPQTPLSFTQQPVNQRVIQLNPATFTASVAGSPPYSVQWYENGQPLAGERQFTLTLPSVTLGMNGFNYSVTVSNLDFGISSTNAALTVLSDTNRPVLLQAASYNGNTVVLTFDEAMDATTTGDYLNYQVNGGAVEVQFVSLSPDAKSVVLTLSVSISDSFSVVVNNVQDLAGNPIAPNTTRAGQVVPIETQDLLFDFGGGTLITEFGPAPNDPSNYWNNVTTTIGASDLGEMFNLTTVHNATTPIGLAMIRRFNGNNDNGATTSSVFPTQATRDSLFGNTAVFSGQSNIFPSFKLTALNPARQYNLTFYASRTGVSDNRETGYTVVGASTNFAALNPANNINNTTNIQAITPSASGEISISLAPTANNNNGTTRFTYLGVMRLSPYVAPLQFLPAALVNGKIRLQWTGTGQLQQATTATGPWTAISPAPTSPYEDNLAPGENRFYRLQQ